MSFLYHTKKSIYLQRFVQRCEVLFDRSRPIIHAVKELFTSAGRINLKLRVSFGLFLCIILGKPHCAAVEFFGGDAGLQPGRLRENLILVDKTVQLCYIGMMMRPWKIIIM